jgi:hypothetical protein
MAPNNDLLAIYTYNTKSSQNYVAWFGLNLAMTWFVENTKVYQLGILSNLIVLAQCMYDQRIGRTLLYTWCKSESTNTRSFDWFESHIVSTKINMLSSKTNYQEFAFQASIDFHETIYINTFILTTDLTIVPISKSQYLLSWNQEWSYNSLSNFMSIMVVSNQFFFLNINYYSPHIFNPHFVSFGFTKMYPDPMSHEQRTLMKFTRNILLSTLLNCITLSRYRKYTQ